MNFPPIWPEQPVWKWTKVGVFSLRPYLTDSQLFPSGPGRVRADQNLVWLTGLGQAKVAVREKVAAATMTQFSLCHRSPVSCHPHEQVIARQLRQMSIVSKTRIFSLPPPLNFSQTSTERGLGFDAGQT